jgi:hypothetical protein
MTEMTKKQFPFCVGEPRKMRPLEQIFCMVWMANNFILEELRVRQDLITQQIESAIERECPEYVFQDLHMMWDNVTAAVAFQTFKDIDTWMGFIAMSGFPEGEDS